MNGESPVSENAMIGSLLEKEVLITQTDFLWQALKETANLLMKAIAFFLAVTAAILGCVLSHPVTSSVRHTAFWTITSITLVFGVTVGFVSWGFVERPKRFAACARIAVC